MDGKTKGFSRLGLQPYRRSHNPDLFTLLRYAGEKLISHQLSEIQAGRRITGHGSLHPGERVDAPVQVHRVIFHRLARLDRAPDNRTDHRQSIAHPVLQLRQEQLGLALAGPQRLLGLLALGDVLHRPDHPHGLALRIADEKTFVGNVGVRAVRALVAEFVRPGVTSPSCSLSHAAHDALALLRMDVRKTPGGVWANVLWR